jgi:hypothetical protein
MVNIGIGMSHLYSSFFRVCCRFHPDRVADIIIRRLKDIAQFCLLKNEDDTEEG